MEQFEAISVGASKEHSLEKAMQKMEDDWDPIIFNTTLYRDTGKAAKNILCSSYIIECKLKKNFNFNFHVIFLVKVVTCYIEMRYEKSQKLCEFSCAN